MTGTRIALAGALIAGLAAGWTMRRAGPTLTPIAAIQGAGHLSPLLGREVTVEGVVTAVRSGGFYLQDPAGDGDPATSDAVFVASDRSEVRRGDRVRLTARVAEESAGGAPTGLLVTRLVESRRLEVLGRGDRLPRPVLLGGSGRAFPRQIIAPDELPVDLRDTAQVRRNRFTPATDALDLLEAHEGMLVMLRRPRALGPTEQRSGGRADLFIHPEQAAHSGTHTVTVAGGHLLRSGPRNTGDQNADRIRLVFDPVLTPGPDPVLATGDRLGDVIGVLDYAYGAYQVTAVEPVQVEARSTWRPEVTVLVRSRGRLTIATYNVLNLSPDSSDAQQRALLGEQIVRALGSPEILALQEIQDASGELDDGVVDGRPTLAALAAAVRGAGGPMYAYIEVAPANGRPGGVPGGNIRNAFLYDSARVKLVAFRALTEAVLADAAAPSPAAFTESRDPLETVFEVGGRRIALVNNHLTSRFGSSPVFGAVQPWIQAGEAEREAQVRALHAYVVARRQREPRVPVVVLGDMNTFETTDHLASLLPGRPPVLVNLIERVEEPQRYSYVFEGNAQVLDHVFVTPDLADGAEVDIVHLNADFPATSPASDHDPVVTRFRW